MLSENYINREELLANAYEQGFKDAAEGKTLFDCPYPDQKQEKRSQWLLGLMTNEARQGIECMLDRP
jgi:ribosome modulation factor